MPAIGRADGVPAGTAGPGRRVPPTAEVIFGHAPRLQPPLARSTSPPPCRGRFRRGQRSRGHVGCRGPRCALSDGDTITVLDEAKVQHKIRFAGIDAPEAKQSYGNASKESLSRLVFNKRVEARCHKRDRYGREVCAVFVGSRDVGLEQVHAGMAWWFREYAHEQTVADRGAYGGAEDAARAARRGLWKDAKPVAPWEWRRHGR